ncbi:MAG: hypothetical protein ACXIVQ_16805 [Acidimicrobiales bacterium]
MNVTTVVDDAGTARPEWQATRLAELVFHLTECSADEALVAVSTPAPDAKLSNDEALRRVAEAIVSLRQAR